jgi:hypothetical protein
MKSATGNSPIKQTNKNNNNNADTNNQEDPRAMDAADTLVSLANTPTSEFKPFKQQPQQIEIILNSDQIIEKTIALTSSSPSSPSSCSVSISNTISNQSDSQSSQLANVESACKLILQQVLKQCSVSNLASITIKTTAAAATATTITNNASNSNNSIGGEQIILNSNLNSTPLTNRLTESQAKKTKKFKHINDYETTTCPLPTTCTAPIAQNLLQSVILPDENNINNGNIEQEPQDNDNDEDDDESDLDSVSSYAPGDLSILSNNSNKKSNSSVTASAAAAATGNQQSSNNVYYSNSSGSAAGIVRPAPTLATGRRSKDVELPPEESKKRQERRERNKEAAARCRRKREDLANRLTQQADMLRQQHDVIKRKFQEMLNEKKQLESLLESHEAQCKFSSSSSSSAESVPQQQQQQLIQRIKKEEINEIIKQSNERKKSNKLNDKIQKQSNNSYNIYDETTKVLTPLSLTEQQPWVILLKIIFDIYLY